MHYKGFRQCLKDRFGAVELLNGFGIEGIESYDLRERIAETMTLARQGRVAADPLIEFYINFQEESNYHAKKRLILSLRDDAEDQGRDLAISANSYAIGSNRPGGYWAKGLQFSDLIDFFTFENTYTALEYERNIPFPRNKWLAWERLAGAATNAPAVILLDASAAEDIAATFPLGRKYLSASKNRISK